MKRFTLLVLALCCSVVVWSQHKKRVLIEGFTQASCGPCAAQNPAFNAKLVANAAIVTTVKYQTSWPGVDPMNAQNRKEVAARVDYYDVTGVPNVMVNGIVVENDCGAFTGAPACLDEAEILAANEKTTPVTILVSHGFTADFDSVLITVKVKSDESLSGPIRLRTAILESKINFTTAPGSNGEKDFFHVMRSFVPSVDGIATGDFAKGEEKTYTLAFPYYNFYNADNLEVVSWLQHDDSKEVYQSEVSPPNTTVVAGNYARVVLNAANATRFTCDPSAKPIIQLRNTGTAQMTKADIFYRLNEEGPWSLFQWTGAINANATATVTLPDLTFPASGPQTLRVRVANTNLGLQRNQNDAAGTINFTVASGKEVLPVSKDFEEAVWPPTGYAFRGTGWRRVSDVGYNSEASMVAPFYNIRENETSELFIPRIDLTGSNGVLISFENAYCWYDSTDGVFKKDSMFFDFSTNCATSWTNVFKAGSDDMATADPRGSLFIPNENEWQENEFSANQMAGKKDVLIRVRSKSGFGNNLFVDNLNIQSVSGTNTLAELGKMEIRPNPAYDQSELRFSLKQPQSLQIMVFDQEGRLVQSKQLGELSSGDHIARLDATTLSKGTYNVSLQSKEGIATMQWFVVR
jgi:hypothetical protein